MDVGSFTFVSVVDYRRTTDGVEVIVDTTEDEPSVDFVGSGKADPPIC